MIIGGRPIALEFASMFTQFGTAQLRTNIGGVFAVGDVNGGPQQAGISLDHHRIALPNLRRGLTHT